MVTNKTDFVLRLSKTYSSGSARDLHPIPFSPFDLLTPPGGNTEQHPDYATAKLPHFFCFAKLFANNHQTNNPLAESAPHQKDNSTNRFLTRVNPITHRYAEAALYAIGYPMFWQMFAFNRQRATFGQHRCRAQVGDAPRAQAALRVSPRAPMAAKASASRCCRCHRLPTPLQHPRC